MNDLVPLGLTLVRVSRLGIGVMTWGQGNRSYGGTRGAAEERGALEASMAAGINFLDTAELYGSGSSERRVGELVRDEAVVIATKFKPLHLGARSLPAALDGSLRRLGRKTVDLYQIHWPSPWMSIPALMNRLADAIEAGKARAVGVSNYSEKQMRLAHRVLADRGIPLASNQVQYSLLHREPETNGVLAACRQLGVALIAYMPLASGALTGKYSSGTPPQDRVRRVMMPYFRRRGLTAALPIIGLLRQIGARHGKSPAQVALRWLMHQEGIIPIPGAKNREQAEENAGALTFSLTTDEVDALSRSTMAWKR